MIEELEADLEGSKEWSLSELKRIARERDALKADAAFAIGMLAMMFDKYENGVTCYEDPEELSGEIGNAVSIDNDDFHAIADFLNKHRPIASITAMREAT
jgi:hypothetical protein